MPLYAYSRRIQCTIIMFPVSQESLKIYRISYRLKDFTARKVHVAIESRRRISRQDVIWIIATQNSAVGFLEREIKKFTSKEMRNM
jgi:hypothetical protein